MIYARQKRKENIAEYILYMWQIEDIIRAHEMDIDALENNIISAYQVPEETRVEMREWYENLIQIMRNEKIENRGHCQFLTNLVNDLYEFHIQLLNTPGEDLYQELYKRAQPNIVQLDHRAGHCFDHEIDACLHGLYGLLLINLQKKKVSDETRDAFSTISRMLAHLAQLYRQDEEKDLNVKEPGVN